MVSQFAWGIGIVTNNQAKFLALWKGLEIAEEFKISRINDFGDSMLAIHQFTKAKKANRESSTLSQKILTSIA